MWTNIFRIGELQAVSWFQFLPYESDPNPLPEKSSKAEHKDAATCLVLSAHLQLQNSGFLSTWTNSFVGPWDPSQGVHNPDEKIKLWLFLPGRHSAINESAQAAVSRLRVVASGLWLAPGDSEEVAVALSQALRNSIERALGGLSYVRFGDVFTRCHSSTSNAENFRRMQPTIEFVFAVTEEAIYVHAVISAKHIRGLCSDDLERASKHHTSSSIREGLPVIVAPNGMRGRLTGCCPTDLVKQVYTSKLKASKGAIAGVPFDATQSLGCHLRGQNCYAEVTLGCSSKCSDKTWETIGNENKDAVHRQTEEAQMVSVGRSQQNLKSSDISTIFEKTFIYQAEAVLVPLMHRGFSRTSLRRFCGKNWAGTSLSELWPLWAFPGLSYLEHCLAFGSTCKGEFVDGLEVNSMRRQRRYNSSSNSNSSSISSVSSTSSETDHMMDTEGGDLEADADSLASKRSSLSSNDQFGNDGHRMGKRSRTSTDAFGQAAKGSGISVQDGYKSDYINAEANNLASAGVTNFGSEWDWADDDDEKGIGMDIQTILSEFGDFGDFFENDFLTFGEPPGTAESQALMFPPADYNDVSASPFTAGVDGDPKLSPVALASFEGINLPSMTLVEDTGIISVESTKEFKPTVGGNHSMSPSVGKFDVLTKAEALMTFAPEYAAVEVNASEFLTSIFKSPYLPRSKRVESLQSSSNAYAYSGAPSTPCVDILEEKLETSSKVKLGSAGQETSSSAQTLKLYNHVQSGTKKNNKRLRNDDISLLKVEASSPLSGMSSSSATFTLQRRSEQKIEAGQLLLSVKTVLATAIECLMFQSAMCRIRHTLLSFSSRSPLETSKMMGNVAQDLASCVTSTNSEMAPIKYELKKRDSLTARISGEVDGGILDEPLITRLGVWRSVGVPKGSKPVNMRVLENSPSLANNILIEDDLGLSAQRRPLEELLDAMSLLVQQSTSIVDVSLDMEGSDSSFCWLALQEQRRRGFSCGPSMVHAGCGGLLATCHSVDIAGVDLIDPLSADIQASSMISLLQSDIKLALKSAFGSLDGPLNVIDWCKGRGQLVDTGSTMDVYSFNISETKESSSSVTIAGEPISPSQSIGGSSSMREGSRIDEIPQRRLTQDIGILESEQRCSRGRPTVAILPLPSILVGYQDDWLKTSANCLQLWEKAPLEPYALPKPVTYYAVCPDIEILTSAAADFFQQLGTVYETCGLGTHSPQVSGGQMDISPGKILPSGLVLVDCPRQVKIAGNNLFSVSSISDYFLDLYKNWNLRRFISSLTKVLKDLKLTTSSTQNQKEGSTNPCMVIYVVCPFPEPTAVLQTLIESCAALGSVVLSADRERQSWLLSQVSKAQSCTAAVDEPSTSNVLMLSGFSIPKLVLQIVNIDCLLRLNRVNELAILKDIAFTVYNKVRRIHRTPLNNDLLQSSAVSGRQQASLMHMTSPIPGMWKDCLAPRMSGPILSREVELDSSLRPGTWDNSWQTSRTGLSCDPSRSLDLLGQDETRYMFEPHFILAEPGSLERGSSPIGASLESFNPKSVLDDSTALYMQSSTSGGSTEVGTGSLIDGSEQDSKPVSLHCCYGWTEDWRWLVCIWTDSRGELLDSNIFPFGGISSRQDTKVLQSLFIQLLNQGYQILSSSSTDSGSIKPRDIIITRIGCFFELECQEWQNAIYSVGGNDVKKWPLQLRRPTPDVLSSSTNGTSLQQHEMGLIQERNLPSSPSSSLYSPRAKTGFIKSGLGQGNTKRQLLAGQSGMDNSRGLLQLVQSISLVGVSIDHSVHLMLPADSSPSAGTSNSSSSSNSGFSPYVEGFSPVKSLGAVPASYVLIPSPNMRYLPPNPLQLPTCLTSESPPLAHLLHSKGYAIPLSTGYVVSKAVPTIRRDPSEPIKDDWPSVLAVTLVDHYGGNNSSNNSTVQEKMGRGGPNSSLGKQGRSGPGFGPEAVTSRDYELETHLVLESVAAELHSLSWMTVSPVYLERRTALPFHCDMLLRLRRLLHYADKELSRPPERPHTVS